MQKTILKPLKNLLKQKFPVFQQVLRETIQFLIQDPFKL